MNLIFRGVLAICLLSLSVFASFHVPTRQERIALDENHSFRLATTSFPIHYDLYLKTNVHDEGNRSFTGHVEIEVEFIENSRHLELNCGQIGINFAKVSDSDGNTIIERVPLIFDDDREILIITNEVGDFEAGQRYFIYMDFYADLRLDGTGFYRSFYEDENKGTVWYASTNVSFIYNKILLQIKI